MKINQSQRIGAFQAYQSSGEQRAMNAPGKKLKDEVQISAEAKELLNAKANDRASAEKIDALKKEVATGTYYVETDKLVERILPFLR
ncbi:flagellar biosynthesis anti-sigma factor FlgM [Cohnella massiliensis]|uniref:flagellar biosynthesis anti-sigma factor FlgM n=1 Tax=Cohnella massiliensis TaxID=1816691 RepID=UPI0009B94A93|nr:flagellar biosynthesis anti-sigma factor FlgM [Cohnella massiliensis]